MAKLGTLIANISLFFIGILTSSCSDRQVANELRSFRNSEIMTSIELEKVYGREIVPCVSEKSCARLIIYHDSTACSNCQISHLYDNIDLYEISDSLDAFEVMTIFSPREEEYDNVMKELVQVNFPYPVYVDTYGTFMEANSCIPADARFHTFLLDRDGHPVFVGNPMSSQDLWTLFEKALRNLVENDSENENN
ncbi:MAG: hypothetical protein NC308_01815 [Clostridium sp.]|nr:hypothetical protein [Bacteroides sp.]MCM1197604.1 hypothetical protein [Clostridium sp.]